MLLAALVLRRPPVGLAPPSPPTEIELEFAPSAAAPTSKTPVPTPRPPASPPPAAVEALTPPEPAVPPAPAAPPRVNISPPSETTQARPLPPLALAPEAPSPAPPPRQPTPAHPSSSQSVAATAHPAPTARSRAPRANASGFPAPLFRDFSFAPTGQHGDPTYRAFAAANQSVQRSVSAADSFDARGAEQLGADWLGQFDEWVTAHKFYPTSAAENGEQGSVTIHFIVDRSGKVHGVELVSRSGSQILDLALQSMFRGQRLPQFPFGVTQDTQAIELTMHYILISR